MIKAKTSKGQVTLELTAALIALFTLVAGTFRLFLWVNDRMVLRQEAYDSSRVMAGGATPHTILNPEETKEWLKLCDEGRYEEAQAICDRALQTMVLVNESALPELDILGDDDE